MFSVIKDNFKCPFFIIVIVLIKVIPVFDPLNVLVGSMNPVDFIDVIRHIYLVFTLIFIQNLIPFRIACLLQKPTKYSFGIFRIENFSFGFFPVNAMDIILCCSLPMNVTSILV